MGKAAIAIDEGDPCPFKKSKFHQCGKPLKYKKPYEKQMLDETKVYTVFFGYGFECEEGHRIPEAY